MRPFVDPALKMIMITSWNEWHEDTEIEPTIVTESTSADRSGAGLYTQNYSYRGYGTAFLESTRQLLAPLLVNHPPVLSLTDSPTIDEQMAFELAISATRSGSPG